MYQTVPYAFLQFTDAITVDSAVKDWAYYLLGAYCVAPHRLAEVERYFNLDTHYNQVDIRDDPTKEKTRVIYQFITNGTEALLAEMTRAGYLTFHTHE